ncbi:MAG: helix-turn-helix domain-containing protein [Bacteroidales bacterium]|nr:helix-turn-helix domain-containing protein [Bacteroidales bacterium]
MDRMQIAHRLVRLRTGKDLSVTEVANLLEITRATVYRLERGNLDSLMKYLPGLARAYGCSEEFILLGYEPSDAGLSVSDVQSDYLSKLDSYRENEERMSREIRDLKEMNSVKAELITALQENLMHEREKLGMLSKKSE